MKFLLLVGYTSGRTSVLSFETHFDRALHVITLSAQPVTLTLQDC